jgi:hypothetical protein
MRRIPWVAEQLLSSQDRFRSMEFVSNDAVGSWDYTASNGLQVTLCTHKAILRPHLSYYPGTCLEGLINSDMAPSEQPVREPKVATGISRIWRRNSKYCTSMTSCINYSNSSNYIYKNKESFETWKSEISSVECILCELWESNDQRTRRGTFFSACQINIGSTSSSCSSLLNS